MKQLQARLPHLWIVVSNAFEKVRKYFCLQVFIYSEISFRLDKTIEHDRRLQKTKEFRKVDCWYL